MKQRLAFSAAAVVLAAAAALLRPWQAPSPPALAVSSGGGVPSSAMAQAAPESSPRSAAAAPSSAAAGAARAARAIVYVAGEVLRPGVYALPAGARVVDALHAAGGPAGDADLVAVNLAQPLVDGEEIAVQPKGASSLGSRAAVSSGSGRPRRSGESVRHRRGSRSRSRKAPPAGMVDLNHADAAALEALPGVGPALAQRIVTFRNLNGPFASLDALLDVNGMTDSRLEALAPYALIR